MEQSSQIDWQSQISLQQSSGMTQQVYCKANKLNFHSFSYQLQKSKGENKRFEKSKPTKFLPVQIKSNSPSPSHVYEITPSHGGSLKISKGFDLNEVKSLLTVITQS